MTVAERLVKRGACVDTEDINEGTPVLYALYNGNKTLISLLLRKGGYIDSVQNIFNKYYLLQLDAAMKLLLSYCLRVIRLMRT